ncbi:hypothetical protein P7K49_031325, partial [Saguinus oedipus]
RRQGSEGNKFKKENLSHTRPDSHRDCVLGTGDEAARPPLCVSVSRSLRMLHGFFLRMAHSGARGKGLAVSFEPLKASPLGSGAVERPPAAQAAPRVVSGAKARKAAADVGPGFRESCRKKAGPGEEQADLPTGVTPSHLHSKQESLGPTRLAVFLPPSGIEWRVRTELSKEMPQKDGHHPHLR